MITLLNPSTCNFKIFKELVGRHGITAMVSQGLVQVFTLASNSFISQFVVYFYAPWFVSPRASGSHVKGMLKHDIHCWIIRNILSFGAIGNLTLKIACINCKD